MSRLQTDSNYYYEKLAFKKKAVEPPMPQLSGEVYLASYDTKTKITLQQLAVSTILASEINTGLCANIPAKKWWDFVTEAGKISDNKVSLTVSDYENGTVFLAEAYLKLDEKKADYYYLNMNFKIVKLRVPDWMQDIFKMGGIIK